MMSPPFLSGRRSGDKVLQGLQETPVISSKGHDVSQELLKTCPHKNLLKHSSTCWDIDKFL